MPITIERLPEKPIIMATYHGMITAEDIINLFRHSAALIQPDETTLYRVNLLEHGQSSLAEIIRVVQEIKPDQPGSILDKRFVGLFVGSNPLADLYKDLIQNNLGAANIPVFAKLEEAMIYIDARLADDAQA